MNDRFKFRVWHKPLKQMHYNDFIVTATGYTAKIYQQDYYMMKFNQEDLEFDKQCILMQSTGLKDKNGKLIYEGDIVKRYFICRSSIGNIVEENLFTVKFEDLKFGLFQIAILKGGTDYSPFLNFDEALELEEYAEEMEEITLEVIGNIYENPELLKECE